METNLKSYIKKKFDLFTELHICPTGEQIEKLRHARNEIHADNIVRDIICPPIADMRIH